MDMRAPPIQFIRGNVPLMHVAQSLSKALGRPLVVQEYDESDADVVINDLVSAVEKQCRVDPVDDEPFVVDKMYVRGGVNVSVKEMVRRVCNRAFMNGCRIIVWKVPAGRDVWAMKAGMEEWRTVMRMMVVVGS